MTRTRDILVLDWNDRTNPFAGGSEIVIAEVFGRLAAEGHRVTLLCSGHDGLPAEEELDGIRVVRVGMRYTYNFVVPSAVRRLHRETPFDVLVDNLNKIPLYTPLFSPVPVVGLGHHLFGLTIFQEVPPPVSIYVFLSELGVPWAYRSTPMAVVSESTKEDFVERGLAPDRIRVVYNGLDPEKYRLGDGAKESRPTLLALGRIRKYKRLDLVVDAVAELGRTKYPDLQLLVAGSGNYVEPLKKHAAKVGAERWVRFVGRVAEEEKVRLYRTSWALVMTSPKEGWGLTCMEAQACGTPVVASDSPGLREAVRHEGSGLLVPHGDREALRDALDRILGDADFRSRMEKGALALAAEFSWKRQAGEMLDLIEETTVSEGNR